MNQLRLLLRFLQCLHYSAQPSHRLAFSRVKIKADKAQRLGYALVYPPCACYRIIKPSLFQKASGYSTASVARSGDDLSDDKFLVVSSHTTVKYACERFNRL
jgi:hypothetical protein